MILDYLKVLARSKSHRFAMDANSKIKEELHQYKYNSHPVFYRPGTSDYGLIYEILVLKGKKAEYYVPTEIAPTAILDIGANIGVTSVWLTKKFPAAKIYAFEPLPENFNILLKNTSPYPNITALNYGLGDKDGEFEFYENEDDANKGGGSIYKIRSDESRYGTNTNDRGPTKINIRNTSNALSENDIGHIDILKIDTEGAEFDILSSIPENILDSTKWIMGELHGIKNFETLALIDPIFKLAVDKKIRNGGLLMFFGINRKNTSPQINQ